MKVSSKLSVILIQPSSFLLWWPLSWDSLSPPGGFSWTRFLFIQLKHCSFTSSHLPQGIGPISAPFPGIAWRYALPGTLVHQSLAFGVISKNSLCSPSPRRPRLLLLRYFLKPLSFQLCQGPRKCHSSDNLLFDF